MIHHTFIQIYIGSTPPSCHQWQTNEALGVVIPKNSPFKHVLYSYCHPDGFHRGMPRIYIYLDVFVGELASQTHHW